MKSVFELNKFVTIGLRAGSGGERGVIIGRAEYLDAPPSYYVAYTDGNGCYRKDWFGAEDLSAD